MKPVLVVGAGPVGMTLASELARYGVPVRIVDKAAQRTDKSKALVVWSRTLELLDRGGGSAPFVDAGFKAEAVNFIAGDKVIGRINMEGVQSPYPFGLMLPQSETERLLEERLRGLGVAVERRVELIAFKSNADGVEAVLRHADGREEAVSADWLVGCDGAHSAVRHGLGAPFAGETLKSDWMLADIHMTGYPCPDSETSVYWHHDGVFVIFPISPGRYRVVADLPPAGAEHPPTPTLEQVQAIIDRRGPSGLMAFDPIWLAGFRINGRKVANYRWGRVFLAGDAAHVHSPAGGQGMNTGMQDAFNLAWKLALVVRKTCDEHLLDSYSPERSARRRRGPEGRRQTDGHRNDEESRRPDGAESGGPRHAGPEPGPARSCRHDDGGHDRLSRESAEWPLARRSRAEAGRARCTDRRPGARGIGRHAALRALRGEDHGHGRSREKIRKAARSRHSATFPRGWDLAGPTRRLCRLFVP